MFVGGDTESTNYAYGEGGDDVLFGGGLIDALYGGDGDDLMIDAPGHTIFDGGAGYDTVDLDMFHGYSDGQTQTRGATVDLSLNGAQDLGLGLESWNSLDTFIDVEGLQGTSGADRLSGNAASNVLDGRAGDDILSGRAGDDLLIGGAGNNVLIGGEGRDTAVFDGGHSEYVVLRSAEGWVVKHSTGTSQLTSIEHLRFADLEVALDLVICDPPKGERKADVAQILPELHLPISTVDEGWLV